jgi:hypothetical protein
MKTLLCALFVIGLTVSESFAVLISVDAGPNNSSERRATISAVVGDHREADLNDPGQNATDDQIGIWAGAGSTNWWNSTINNSNSATALVDADGNATGVSYSSNRGIGTDWATSPADDLGWDGHLAFPSEINITTTISGLTANTMYDLVVYHSDAHVSETVTVNGASAIDYTGSLANPGYGDAFDGLSGSDFWYFQVATDGIGDLVISSGGNVGFNTLTGFQVQSLPIVSTVPEPSSLLILTGLAAAMLGLHRRRRTRMA